jgi:hypothetical protein
MLPTRRGSKAASWAHVRVQGEGYHHGRRPKRKHALGGRLGNLPGGSVAVFDGGTFGIVALCRATPSARTVFGTIGTATSRERVRSLQRAGQSCRLWPME